jgi:hypothetical protein
MKDILVLVADQDAEFLLKSLLDKIPIVESMPVIDYEIIRHPDHDSGIATHAVEFVRPYINDYRFLMVTFDYEGSGKETSAQDKLELDIEDDFARNGWQNRNVCITFKPELESWLWVNYIHLHYILDWQHQQNVYEWLISKGHTIQQNKPNRPKEAFEDILRKQNIPRSSSLYSKLAQKASYQQCTDSSFNKFLSTIKSWFVR